MGRVALEDQRDYEGNVIVAVNQEITEELAAAIQAAGIERVKIRSVLTCESKRGVCVACYGRNLATGRLVERGEAVGVIAAQSIGEPGTQLTMRTFHIGGTATRISEQSKQDAKSDGFAKYINIQWVRNEKGEIIAMNRNGILAIVDDKSREKERYPVVYGARITVAEGDPIKANQILLEWDPYTFSILTELSGVVHFKDLQEGITLAEQVDEVTGMSQLVVTDSPDEKRQPMVQIKGPGGSRKYLMPTHAHLMVHDGEEVHAGDVLAKIPRETTKTKDITGGLPRVVELFEARKPRESAIMAEINGIVKYGELSKGQRKIYIVGRRWRGARIFAASRRPYQRAGRRARGGGRSADGWSAQSARHSGCPRREGTAEVSRQRNSGSLPAAGREHQRQASGSHLAPDDALGARGRYRRHGISARRSGR